MAALGLKLINSLEEVIEKQEVKCETQAFSLLLRRLMGSYLLLACIALRGILGKK